MNSILSWLGNLFAPVVESVVAWATPILEPILTPLVQFLGPVLTPAFEALGPILEPILQPLIRFLEPVLEPLGEATAAGLMRGLDQQFRNNYQPEDSNLARFEPVVPESEQVQQVVKADTTLTQSELAETRDAMIASRIGYADYSELREKGVLDSNGYVINDAGFYREAGKQTSVPLSGENWSSSEIAWAQENFDIIRVMEQSGNSQFGGYEANVALMKHKKTGEYFISVGGTDSVKDALTDFNLIVNSDTGPSRAAIRGIIDKMLREDVPANAVVNLAGHSLGGAEVIQQYRDTPHRFDHVYALNAVGTGGFDGTYYENYVWDKKGDPHVTEIRGDDAGTDFNDLVVYWGVIGAGRVIDLGDIPNVGESDVFGPDLELLDAHLLGNMWAALPQSGKPDPVGTGTGGSGGTATTSISSYEQIDAREIYLDYRDATINSRKGLTENRDTYTASNRSDMINARGDNDNINGAGGNDLILLGSGNDIGKGSTGHDYIKGEAGNDQLLGGDGNDFLAGGAGSDKLTGGNGADVFVFAKTDSRDRIYDFNAHDTLLFSDANSMKDLKITQEGAHTLIEYNGAHNWVEIQNFNKQNLDADNFAFG